jgi:N-acetylmuramoyl-L-alanine amidase
MRYIHQRTTTQSTQASIAALTAQTGVTGRITQPSAIARTMRSSTTTRTTHLSATTQTTHLNTTTRTTYFSTTYRINLILLVLIPVLIFASSVMCLPALAKGSLEGVKIFIDPGHGGPDPGAVGLSGLHEADVNLRVSRVLSNCLTEYAGAQVMMSRTENVDVSLGERVRTANNWGADRFISVHHNASVNRDYNATETYTYYYADRTAIDMQEKVHNRLLEGLGLRDGKARTAGFYVLRYTSMPAILTEASYISNPYEEARLKDMGYTWREGYYIYLGIADHFGVSP